MLNIRTLTGFSDSPTESGEPDSSRLLPSTAQPRAETPLAGLSLGRGRVGQRRPSSEAARPESSDPWSQTLAALRQFSDPSEVLLSAFAHSERRHAPPRTGLGDAHVKTFTVTVLEHMANSRVCLSWHDPTLCNYEEQVWTPALARRSGQCALSGANIRRGESVYRPQMRGRTPPANGDAMILASALKRVRDG